MKNKKSISMRRKNKMSKTRKNKKPKNTTKKIGGSVNSQRNSESEETNKAINTLTKKYGPNGRLRVPARWASKLTSVEQERVGRRIKMANRSGLALLIAGAMGGLVAILANQ
jgi:hypothetical protein